MPKKSIYTVWERLKMKTDVPIDPQDCWLWQGAKNNIGYGMIRDGDKMRTTHRVSYEYNHGNIPIDKVVCHTCDIPACVNPAHLWAGTRKENAMDMVEKGRQSDYNRKGGTLTPEIVAALAAGKAKAKEMRKLNGTDFPKKATPEAIAARLAGSSKARDITKKALEKHPPATAIDLRKLKKKE
jgi:hypothetical protein